MQAELEKVKSPRGKVTAVGKDIHVEDEPAALAVMSEIFSRADQGIILEAQILLCANHFRQRPHIAKGYTNGHQGRLPISSAKDASGSDGTNPAVLSFGFLNKAASLYLNAEINAAKLPVNADRSAPPESWPQMVMKWR